jgi:hypothetical protein
MFLRFKTDSKNDGSIIYRVQLIRAFRCPVTGKPKSRMLAHVCSITAADCQEPMSRWLFWHRLEETLARLPIEEADKQAARRSALQRVQKSRLPLPLAP